MDPGYALAAAGLLVLAVIAIIFVFKKGPTTPTCPPGPDCPLPGSDCPKCTECPPPGTNCQPCKLPDVKSFVFNDGDKVPTTIACDQNSRIKVRNSVYGAPWSDCKWKDTTVAADTLMSGKQFYTIPANDYLPTRLKIDDPCVDKLKTFAGAFTCESI